MEPNPYEAPRVGDPPKPELTEPWGQPYIDIPFRQAVAESMVWVVVLGWLLATMIF
jgi:hypothetical protein